MNWPLLLPIQDIQVRRQSSSKLSEMNHRYSVTLRSGPTFDMGHLCLDQSARSRCASGRPPSGKSKLQHNGMRMLS